MELGIQTILTALFLALGCVLIIISSIGVIIFPDFYTRMHAASKVDTLGQALVLIGLMVYAGLSFVSLKILIIMLLIFLINPTASHFLAKAAYVKGLKHWEKGAALVEHNPFYETVKEAANKRKTRLKTKN